MCRELQNYFEHASMSHTDELVCPESLAGRPAGLGTDGHCTGSELRQIAAADSPDRAPLPPAVDLSSSFPTLAEVERAHIRRALERADDNRTIAARLLGIPQQQLLRKIGKYQIASSPRPGRPCKPK